MADGDATSKPDDLADARRRADLAEERARLSEAEARTAAAETRRQRLVAKEHERARLARFQDWVRALMLATGLALTGAGVADADINWLEDVPAEEVLVLGTGVAAASAASSRRQEKRP